MIVVGFLGGSDRLAVEIARRVAGMGAGAGTGARVEMVGAAPPDSSGDRRLIELAEAGIGHATVIRSGAGDIDAPVDRGDPALDAADLDLALRYLPDVRCVVLVRPPLRLIGTAVADAEWAGAPLVLIGPLDAEALAALKALESLDARGAGAPFLLEPPASDSDGTFAGFVAALAIRLDAGEPPESAFRATTAALGADPV